MMLCCFPRYWRDLHPTKNVGAPSGEWTTDAWETFLLLGAPGFNEPHLIPTVAPGRVGGTSGPPARAATKKRMRLAAAEKTPDGADKPVEGNDSGSGTPCTPMGSAGTPSLNLGSSEFSDGETAAIQGAMKAVQAGIQEQLDILKEFAARERERISLKKRNSRLEHLKAQIQFLPMGSPGHARALAQLEMLHASDSD